MDAGPLEAPAAICSAKSERALDWVNFFLAALLMGFGPYLTIQLTDHNWTAESIGLVLTVAGLAGLVTQLPAGELIDTVRSKRALIAIAGAAAALALLVFGFWPDFLAAMAAALVRGAAGSILGPAIAAVSLGLVGHDALAERLGRNQRFASIGSLVAAAIMGAVGYLLSTPDIFVLAAALLIPLLLALQRIRAADIHFSRSCGAHNHQERPQRVNRSALFKDERLLTFAICLFLFQLANASLLPQLGQTLAHVEGHSSSLVVSALVVGPQIVVVALASWAGRAAVTWGRRPLLIIGLAAVPIRAGVFALTLNPAALIVLQLLDGLSGATLGVLTALVVADITKGTGRFNLAQGFVGTLSAIGASLSTSLAGIIVERFGPTAGLLCVTMVGQLAVVVVVAFMPETKPPERTDSERGAESHRAGNFAPAMTVTRSGRRLTRSRRRRGPTPA